MKTAQTTTTGASFRRGGSKQDYETPRDFLDAVESRWGKVDVDLAATRENAKAARFVSPAVDSLGERCRWDHFTGLLWLNPPFSDITPWAKKCAQSAPTLHPLSRILLLVPASVGANWFAEHVHGRAHVWALQGRITFVGAKDPYPKDCILAEYARSGASGFSVWPWGSP